MNRESTNSRPTRNEPRRLTKYFKLLNYYPDPNGYHNNYSNFGSPRFTKNTHRFKQNQIRRRFPIEYKISHSEPEEQESSPSYDAEGEILRKIQETSDMIKRQLLSPESSLDSRSSTHHKSQDRKDISNADLTSSPKQSQIKEKRKSALFDTCRKNEMSPKNTCIYNAKEIHSQIIDHILKLNYGRKQNFINADTTGYDAAIQQIYKKKSLELSKALRDLSHQEQPKSSNIVNSIIPDFNIKIEELPLDIIRELSSSFEAVDKNVNIFEEFSLNHASNQHSNIYKSSESFDQAWLNIQPTSEIRVVHLSTEDADSIAVKKEDSFKTVVKSEPTEIIEISGSEDLSHLVEKDNQPQKEAQKLSHMNNTKNIEETDHTDSIKEASLVNTVPSSTILKQPKENLIGSLRINSNLFEEKKTGNKKASILHENVESIVAISNASTNKVNKNDSNHVSRENVFFFNFNKEEDKVLNENSMSAVSVVNDSSASNNWSSKNDSQISTPNASFISNNMHTLSLHKEKNITIEISDGHKQKESKACLTENSQDNPNPIVEKKTQFVDVQSELSNPKDQQILPIRRQAAKKQMKKSIQKYTDEIQHSIDNDNIETEFIEAKSGSYAITDTTNEINIPDSSEIKCEQIKGKKCVSLIINSHEKPKTFKEAIKMMFDIDESMEKLMKFRKKVMHSLKGYKDHSSSDNIVRNSRKRKRNGSLDRKGRTTRPDLNIPKCTPTLIETAEVELLEESLDEEARKIRLKQIDNSDSPKKDEHRKSGCNQSQLVRVPVNHAENNFDLNTDCQGTPLICRVTNDDTLVVGTDCGKLQYFNLKNVSTPLTVSISRYPISCLECMNWNKREGCVLTGTASEKELKILKYRENTVLRSIMLDDVIQAVHKEWKWIFIGGSSGYLTRYNLRSQKVQFEDRISEMKLSSLMAKKEGPRKILIILLIDYIGESHVHIRDALSALHIRTISGNMQAIHFPTLSSSTLYTVCNQEISSYNSNDGLFITKFQVPSRSSITMMQSIEHLLLAASSEGIYVYDLKTHSYMGFIECHNISFIKIRKNKIIYGTWSKQLKTLQLPSYMLASNQV